MKLSSQEHITPGGTFAERTRYLAGIGFEGIELTLGDRGVMLGSLRHRVDEVLSGCRDTGIQVSVITTKVFDLLEQDRQLRAKAMAEVRDGLEFAARVSALGIVIVPRFGPPSLPDLSPLATARDLEHRLLVLELMELARDAERLGVQIMMEPLHRYLVKFLRTVDHGIQICRDVGSPAVRLMVDTFQSYNEEVNVPLAMKRTGELLSHVHISDSNRRLPPQGSTDFGEVVSVLKEIGYNGYLSFECDVEGDLEPQFRAAAEHMQALVR